MVSCIGKADVSVSRNSKVVITFGVSLILSWFLFFSLVSATSHAHLFVGTGMGDPDSSRSDLYLQILRDEAVARLNELGKVTVSGAQGHAGTVPMSMRRDPMAAAAELIGLLESLCKDPENYLSYDGHCKGFTSEFLAGSLVCTVGEISSWPSASNVIPGHVIFSIDLRAMEDMAREAIIIELSNRMYHICDRRSVSCIIERKHDAGAVICVPGLSSKLKSAAYSALKKMAGDIEDEVPVLMSGAGHDAMTMSHLTEVGMLFVRCRGGISHSPAEHVLDDDIWAAGLAVLEFLGQHVY